MTNFHVNIKTFRVSEINYLSNMETWKAIQGSVLALCRELKQEMAWAWCGPLFMQTEHNS